MYKYRYTNPLTRQFQAEYAMYEAVSSLFAGVICRSLTLENLKLYHAELSKEKSEELENEVKHLIGKYLTGKVCFPAMNICKAEVKIRNNADGTHRFIFTDGVYSFSLQLKTSRRSRKMFLEVKGRNITGLKPSKKSRPAAAVNAQRCA